MKSIFSNENPYRCFFPLGAFSSAVGVFLWIAFPIGWIKIYPTLLHSHLMIGSFVHTFAIGFLWTAIPRFLQVPYPKAGEVKWQFFLCLASALSLTSPNAALFYTLQLFSLFLTINFGVRSFRDKKSTPFPSFLFIFFGFCLAIISLIIMLCGSLFEIPFSLELLAKTFFLKGFILFLYLGVGSKLIPILCGWDPMPQKTNEKFQFDFLYLFSSLILLAGLTLESQGEAPIAGLLYGIILSSIALLRMRAGKIPKEKSALSFSIWLASIFISLSPFSLIIFPSYTSHFWHLIFISGFSLLTLFVSLRVTLAHSAQDYLLWEKKPVFYVLGFLVIFASITRISAPFLPKIMLSHYAYASATLILALIIWFFYFLKFTFSGNASLGKENTERNC